MLENGYSFDYVSDKQIGNLVAENGKLKSKGGAIYQTIVMPQCEFIPASTLQKLVQLAEEGATVIAFEGLPKNVSGFGNLESNRKIFQEAMAIAGNRFMIGNSLEILLSNATIRKEDFNNLGIDFIRKKGADNRTIYFISNKNTKTFDGWLPLQAKAKSVILYDPMTGAFGKAKVRNESGTLEVYVQLTSKQSLIVETYPQEIECASFQYIQQGETKIALNGIWSILFLDGGPTLPLPQEVDSLKSWTTYDAASRAFSGTVAYNIRFELQGADANVWLLDLGKVKESAEVFLNGQSIGTLIGPSYQIVIPKSQLQQNNELEIQVSNLMANRIADLDKRNVFWKKFYNINFPARKSENRKNGLFDASGWEPRESGLLGPVTLTVLEKQ
jgi:hypothetical protein